ncbi:protoporphyrinogen oxidase [Gorillibacterium timonense]|uniref:protoporphyrinogen oxidase n=1 Tax=Gorillibacterium timonense TaxID=1689269 RepID=UPI00071C45A6|nr:protoporphyrinogen oxidase [Gorillibacterium timonense]
MSRPIRQVVIIGGGITGLTAAYYANRYASDAEIPMQITILEKSSRLGGKVHTLHKNGFTIEKGADSFLTRKQPMIELTRELGLEDRFVGQGSRGKRSYFLHHGQFYPAPSGMVLGIPTDLSAFMETGLVSPDGKARALEDLSLPKKDGEGDESLGGFLERRLGPEMVANVAEPLLAGIYAGDLYKLSLEATFPQFKEAERQYGSVIQGMQVSQAERKAQMAPTPKAAAGSAFLSYRDGLSTVIEGLERAAAETGTKVLRETYAVRIDRAPGKGDEPGYRVHLNRGDYLEADAVIVTLPTYEYPSLLPHLPGLVKLSEMPYVSVANVVLAYEEADVPVDFDGSGFVISRKEGRFITACTRTSLKWESTAPPGKVLLRCYVGRAGDQDWVKLTDEEIVAKVRQEVKELLRIEAEPLFHELTRLYRSMPNYPVGHLEHIQAARKELAAVMPGVYLTGAAFDGVGLPDCVRQGRETAEAVVMRLKKQSAAAEASEREA